ncbi:hypothetical protein [Lentzea atacamensis]|nr:hypothetical protein [Lentzea atacamensis]
MLLDSFTDAHGAPCFTTLDRRWLWRIENQLAVCAPSGGYLAQLRKDLYQYLCETCIHHWNVWPGDEHIEAHRQCTWCNHVEWGQFDAAASGRGDAA